MGVETERTLVLTRLVEEREVKEEIKEGAQSVLSHYIWELASFSVDHYIFWNVVFIMCCHSFCIN